jgi:hypothetical protein
VSFSWKGLSGGRLHRENESARPVGVLAGQASSVSRSQTTAALPRRRHVYRHGKGCQTISFGSLKGGANEGVTDQG